MPDGSAGFVGESQATARRFCVFWGVGAQRVRGGCVTDYGCTSNAPTSHIGLRELRHGTGVQRTSTPLVWKLALTSWTDSAGSMTHSQPSGAIGVTMSSSVKSTLR